MFVFTHVTFLFFFPTYMFLIFFFFFLSCNIYLSQTRRKTFLHLIYKPCNILDLISFFHFLGSVYFLPYLLSQNSCLFHLFSKIVHPLRQTNNGQVLGKVSVSTANLDNFINNRCGYKNYSLLSMNALQVKEGSISHLPNDV